MCTVSAEDAARRESDALCRGCQCWSARGGRGGCGERGEEVCTGAHCAVRGTGCGAYLVQAVSISGPVCTSSCEMTCRASLIRTVALTGQFLMHSGARDVPCDVPARCWKGPLRHLRRAAQPDSVPPNATYWAPSVRGPSPQPAFGSWSEDKECQWVGGVEKM